MPTPNRHHPMRTVLVALLLIVAFAGITVPSSQAARQRSKYGIDLPYLKTSLVSGRQDSLLVGRPPLAQSLNLSIDVKGRVTGAQSSQVVSQDWHQRLLKWLTRAKFEPGKINGKKQPMQLRSELFLSPIDSSAILRLPTDTAGRIADYSLYSQVLSDVMRLPAVDSFPWYHAVFRREDSARGLPYVLLQTSLDTSGELLDVRVSGTNFHRFADQLVSASTWAEYRPATGVKLKTPDTTFLLITFFPTTRYPNSPWTPARADSMDLQDRMAVRLFVDTVGGIMIPPIPRMRRDSASVITMRIPPDLPLVCRFLIDTLGIASPMLDSTRYPNEFNAAAMMARQLAFYPAMDFAGNRIPYRGVIELEPAGAATVRVRLWWLHPK